MSSHLELSAKADDSW
jgi:hypothetical protein